MGKAIGTLFVVLSLTSATPAATDGWDAMDAAVVPVPGTTTSYWAVPEETRPPIDVNFSALEVTQAVRFLTGQETNVVAAGFVPRPVTLELRGVPVGQALEWLLEAEGLAARFEGNAVFLSSEEQRVYPLPLVVQEASKIWDEIESGIQGMNSTSGAVAVNRSAGVLTIRDTPANLDHLEAHLYQVLLGLQRQVEIEVKILEVVFEDNQETGVDWTLFNGIMDPDWDVTGGSVFGNVGFSSPTDQRHIFQFGLLKPGKWQAFIDAFEEEITLDMISRPRITAMSNQPAKFEVKERIPYLTKTVTQEGGVPITEFELQFDEAGIELEVTASVSDEGVVTMDVHPKIASVVGFTQSLPDLGPQPIIDTRETHSTVRLPEDHSLVMSGLMQDRENITMIGIPVLSKIPLLGRLFRSDKVSTDKTEIVIVLTPRLRRDEGTWSLKNQDRIRPFGFAPETEGALTGLAGARGERAWKRMASGDGTGALQAAQSAVRAKPATWWTLNNLGLAERDVGYLSQAESTLRQAVNAHEPAAPVALHNLGTLLIHRGRAQEAGPLLARAVAAAAPGPLLDESLLAWALALERSGQPQESLAVLERAGGTDGRLAERVRPSMERVLATLAQ